MLAPRSSIRRVGEGEGGEGKVDKKSGGKVGFERIRFARSGRIKYHKRAGFKSHTMRISSSVPLSYAATNKVRGCPLQPSSQGPPVDLPVGKRDRCKCDKNTREWISSM